MISTWMGDHSIVIVNAVVKNTVTLPGVEKRGLQKHTPVFAWSAKKVTQLVFAIILWIRNIFFETVLHSPSTFEPYPLTLSPPSQFIPHPSFLNLQPSPFIPHISSLALYPPPFITHPSFLTPHSSPLIPHPPFLTPHSSPLIPHPSSLTTHL